MRKASMCRRGVVGLAFAILGIGEAALSPATSGADTGALTGVSAIALAEGVRVTFTIPAYSAVEEVFNGGGGVAQSVVDSFGASGFASLPHPGDLVLAAPGLLSFATGVQAPLSYPLYVSATHPVSPAQDLSDPSGSYELHAMAARNQAEGWALLRGDAAQDQDGGSGGTRSFTSAIRDDEKVTVEAATVSEALTLGQGALQIASVRSRSLTTYELGQAVPETTSELIVEGGAAGGYSFRYDSQGLAVAKQGVPVPARATLEDLNQALKVAGISVRIAEAQPVVGGESAAALEILAHQESPTPAAPSAILAFRFGGATTSVSGVPSPPGKAIGPGEEGPAGPVVGPAASGMPRKVETSPVSVGARPEPLRSGGDAGQRARVNPMPSASSALAASELAPRVPGGEWSGAEVPVSERATPVAAPHIVSSDERLAQFAYGMILVAAALLVSVGGLWRSRGSLST